MPVNHIQPDPGVDQVSRQKMQMLQHASKKEGTVKEKQSSNGDTVEISQMARELGKYKKMIQDIPEPNEGRIGELQDAIKDGKLMSDEAISGSASAIADVLLR